MPMTVWASGVIVLYDTQWHSDHAYLGTNSGCPTESSLPLHHSVLRCVSQNNQQTQTSRDNNILGASHFISPFATHPPDLEHRPLLLLAQPLPGVRPLPQASLC